MEKEPPVGQRGRTGGDRHGERTSCGSKSPPQEEISMEKEPPEMQKIKTGENLQSGQRKEFTMWKAQISRFSLFCFTNYQERIIYGFEALAESCQNGKKR